MAGPPAGLARDGDKSNGEKINLVIGEKPDDPVFTVSDLLPHLARKVQMEKKLSEAIEGEKLNILLGSLPLGPPGR